MRRSTIFTTTVGAKVLIALTGLAMFLYLLLHLAGNLLVFLGPGKFNGYSHFLISNPLIIPFELGLLAIFLLHIYKTVKMWIANRRARPIPYAKKRWAGPPSRKSISSSTMIYTGLLTALFVIVHLKEFKYGAYYLTPTDVASQMDVTASHPIRDLYRLEMENFSHPLIVVFYVVSMVIVGFHVGHGFWSATQSLGVDNPKLSWRLLRMSKVMAVLIGGGFLIIPIWAYFAGGR